MAAYTDFAWVYDELMDTVPYEKWAEDIIRQLQSEGIKDGLILDLGCGTGIITEMLAFHGYDLIGVDISEDMLGQAIEKKYESGYDILYLNQDMREFELYGTVRAVVCVCDSINYLLCDEDMVKTFSLVNNYLDPEGLFIFDVNTPYKYKNIGDSVIAENREDCSFIWENDYNEKTGINEYMLTLYISDGEGKYDRCEESHYQRGYDISQIIDYLNKAGMVFVKAYDSDSHGDIGDKTQRFTVIAKEKGKNA